MKQQIVPFALVPLDAGCRNQIFGAINAINDIVGNRFDINELLVFPEDVSSYQDIKTPLFYSSFKSYGEFKNKIFSRLDAYMQKVSFVPRIFITVYNPTESSNPAKDTDKLCAAVKEYYAKNNLGNVLTVVLTSRYYKYKNVDMINIPKHLLTFSSRIRMLKNQNIRKNILVTIGTINNFNIHTVKNKFNEFTKILTKLKKDDLLRNVVEKYERYKKTSKKVVFLLGGRVEGPEIVFDLDYARKLYSDALKLQQAGFGVVITNGPRTPNNVTDYFYEKSSQNNDIIFQNSKKIATSDEDRAPSKWRIYSGKHEEEFKKLQAFGNIYPAILGFDNTLVVHTMDSYSSCETSSAGFPTAISTKGIYVDPVARYDCQNLVELLCPKYAIDFDEFVKIACAMKIEPKDLHPQILSSALRVFAETAINKFIALIKKSDRM